MVCETWCFSDIEDVIALPSVGEFRDAGKSESSNVKQVYSSVCCEEQWLVQGKETLGVLVGFPVWWHCRVE
jgi:hypothetical protein